MECTFRKQKMLDRLAREGRMDLVGPDEMACMEMLDGLTGSDYNWRSQVYGEPLVLITHPITGESIYVNAADCD